MAIEHHITLEERTDTLAYASATTPPAPTMPNVKARDGVQNTRGGGH